MEGANTLANYNTATITAAKMFYSTVFVPGLMFEGLGALLGVGYYQPGASVTKKTSFDIAT